MKLKLDDNGNALLTDGKPTYIGEDGKDFVFDAPQMYGKITELTRENAKHRERAETAEATAKAFEGIDDPAAARKALETMANLDSKKLIDAGEVERVKSEVIAAVEAKYAPFVEKAETLEKALHSEKIGGSFARSKFIADKLAIPADMVQAAFGKHLKLEGGKVIAYDNAGNQILSRSNPGEVADFDEALEILVDQYPNKDQILKGTGASGSGAGSGAFNGSGGKTMSRAQFEALGPTERVAAIKDTVITE